jgi:glycosyltransferase involved in cell wall biosynthesis
LNQEQGGITYVLITPARNEEANIEKTIRSVISQTLLPKKWVIVSDGSTDRTEDIVKQYLKGNSWMELVRMPEHRERTFAAKVHCFNAGYERVKNISFEVVGNLDADISFDCEYLAFLMEKFAQKPDLGVAGTPFIENGYSSLKDSFEGEKHVAGGVQLFRKDCFEEIGGYIPNRAGGIDWIAVTTARMKGWKTQSFKEKFFHHHRPLGMGGSNRLGALFNHGRKDYYLGGHPLWEAFRIVYRLAKKPIVTGSIALTSGYLWGVLTRMERPVSSELIRFHRREQMDKLNAILKDLLSFKKIDNFRINS